MYASWSCPQADDPAHEEMVLRVGAGERRLLVLPPLFDEANKFRAQIFAIAREMSAHGIEVVVPDLPGCNESTREHAQQTLAGWRDAAARAARALAATHVLAIRSSCWIAPSDLPAWHYAPVEPARILRAMLRANALAAREAGPNAPAAATLETASEVGMSAGGWVLGAELVRELATATFDAPETAVVVSQEDIGGRPLWLRAENDTDAAQALALAALVTAGMARA